MSWFQRFKQWFDTEVDIVRLSLAGMVIVVVGVLSIVAMSVFGYAPPLTPFFFTSVCLVAIAALVGLYSMNFRVHRDLRNHMRLTKVLVNSLGQGFLLFSRNGICGDVYSQACLDLLETMPAGRHIIDVLRVPEPEQADFRDWIDMLFIPHHALGFEDITRFMPQTFRHNHDKHVTLVYRPIYGKDQILSQVVVIATDATEEYQSQMHAQQQQNYANMICSIFKERNQFLATITHIRKFIEAVDQTKSRENSPNILRLLHTLKSAVLHFHLDDLGRIVGDLEGSLRDEALISDAAFLKELAAGRKRVDEGLQWIMGEVTKLIGQDYEGRGNMREVTELALYDFARDMEQKNVDPVVVRQFLVDIVAVPANECFHLFEREVRDLAEIIGKQVKPIRFTGSNPRILLLPIKEFLFSLTHVSTNIIDHGIEASVTRLARGKDPVGQISIHVETYVDDNRSEWLHIIISDDGNGVDPTKVREKLQKVDPDGSWRDQNDEDVIQNIFSWGFSTRDQISDLSGRGVGMEAVYREVKLLGGDIRVYSELYKGTRFDIRVPYSFDLSDHSLD